MTRDNRTLTDILALARDIAEQGKVRPFGPGGYYEAADWQSAADTALTSGDTAELADMLATEDRHSEYLEWLWGYGNPAVQERRENVDFRDWLEGDRGNMGAGIFTRRVFA